MTLIAFPREKSQKIKNRLYKNISQTFITLPMKYIGTNLAPQPSVEAGYHPPCDTDKNPIPGEYAHFNNSVINRSIT